MTKDGASGVRSESGYNAVPYNSTVLYNSVQYDNGGPGEEEMADLIVIQHCCPYRCGAQAAAPRLQRRISKNDNSDRVTRAD